MPYNYHQNLGARSAHAQFSGANASYKDLVELCRAIRGKPLEEARVILQGVIDLKRPIRYVRYAKGTGHKGALGGKPGRFPQKEAKLVRHMLENAAANANGKGLDPDKLVVGSCAAYKQAELPRYRKYWVGGAVIGYGRQAVYANLILSRAELTLVEKEFKKKAKKQRGAKAGPVKGEASKKEATSTQKPPEKKQLKVT